MLISVRRTSEHDSFVPRLEGDSGARSAVRGGTQGGQWMAERVAQSWLVGWRAVAVGFAPLMVFGFVAWQAITAHGAPALPPDGLTPAPVILNSGILVFR